MQCKAMYAMCAMYVAYLMYATQVCVYVMYECMYVCMHVFMYV